MQGWGTEEGRRRKRREGGEELRRQDEERGQREEEKEGRAWPQTWEGSSLGERQFRILAILDFPLCGTQKMVESKR